MAITGLTVFLLILLLALMVLAWVTRQVVKIIRRRRPKLVINRCSCGYELTKLELIRCPECGKVFGFNATPEELGLSEEELRRTAEARERHTKAKAP